MSLLHHRKTLTLGMVLAIPLVAALVLSSGRLENQAYIVKVQDLATIKAAVQAVGDELTHELGIINTVASRDIT